MDSLKNIKKWLNNKKNKVIDFLTLEKNDHILKGASLSMIDGKISDVIKYKRMLYKRVNTVLSEIERNNIELVIDDTKPSNDFISLRLNTPYLVESFNYSTHAKNINKSDVVKISITGNPYLKAFTTNACSGDICLPEKLNASWGASDLIAAIKEKFHTGEIYKITMKFPKIVFDIMENEFKLELNISSVLQKFEESPKYVSTNLLIEINNKIANLDKKDKDYELKYNQYWEEYIKIGKSFCSEEEEKQIEQLPDSSNRILGKVLDNLEAKHGKNAIIDIYKNKLSEQKELINYEIIEMATDTSLHNLHLKDSATFDSQYGPIKQSNFV